MKKQTKKLGCYMSLGLLVLLLKCSEKQITEKNIYINHSVSEEPMYCLSCSAGDIYIGTRDQIEEYGMPKQGIMVLDDRYTDNPNMKIYSSYKINSPFQMREILTILDTYNKNTPSEWDRSLISMEIEWTIHNNLYYLGYKRTATKDVDLDNNDEGVISPKNISLILDLDEN